MVVIGSMLYHNTGRQRTIWRPRPSSGPQCQAVGRAGVEAQAASGIPVGGANVFVAVGRLVCRRACSAARVRNNVRRNWPACRWAIFSSQSTGSRLTICRRSVTTFGCEIPKIRCKW